MKHTIIYREEGRYAAWPANYGIWSWGDEIVVGFTSGYHLNDGGFHARDRSKPFTTMQARSKDGGQSWKFQEIPTETPGNKGQSAGEHADSQVGAADIIASNEPTFYPGGIDFTNPDFAMIFARSNLTGGSNSWFYTSTDRCHSWQGPYILPMMGQIGIAARTDYIILGPERILFFLTAPTQMGTETGSRVFCAETVNGGRSFEFKSWVAPQCDHDFNIMPASVRMTDSHLLVATRDRRTSDGHPGENWIDLYHSTDLGASWTYMNRPVAETGDGGNPATLTKLADGRLCLTYGYRNPPFGIRAKLSDDNGISWGEEIILRSDAGSHDIGYTRTALRPDGKLVTVYYYNDNVGGACYIAATIWKP